tara:strand:- start:411 stop:4250 length:3840 start_codon:yes stop_codon:yes gene_type:complete
MVDSSIGGKTGINNLFGKNLIGSFYKPKKIIIDINFLKTLPKEEIINGFAEIIKMGIVVGGKLWDILESNNLDIINNTDKLLEIIKLSALSKFNITENDFKETNNRMILNYGHTIGHAIESLTLMKHGFCVSLGICYEMLLKRDNKYITPFYLQKKITNVLKNYGLPIKLKYNLDVKDICKKIILDKKDKKVIVVTDIGIPIILDITNNDIISVFTKQRKLIYNKNNDDIEINIPGSKSETNRVLLLGAFGQGKIIINNILLSDDTFYMINALEKLGVDISIKKNQVMINGCNGNITDKKIKLYLGNSGTCIRFLTGILSFIAKSEIILDGDEYMRKRPINDLIKSLQDIGVNIRTLNNDGYPPIIINKSDNIKSLIKINTDNSSQYLTGLLLGSCLYNKDIIIRPFGKMVSKKFIFMTLSIMNKFNINVQYDKEFYNKTFRYINPENYFIQADATSASYILAGCAILNKSCIINNLNKNNLQGDLHYCKYVLEQFGFIVNLTNDFFELKKEKKEINKIINLDMDSSDTFLTWCVFACYFPYLVKITNIDNQNIKECKRIDVIYDNLKKIGVNIIKENNNLFIKENNSYKGTLLKCHNDHRMAMSLSLLGLFCTDIYLDNYLCINKTYPHFWEDIQKIGLNIKYEKQIEKNNKKIILIGMTCSGKTTLGKFYAKQHNLKYLDTDDEITKLYNMKPHEIIKNHGWKYFREIEEYIFKNYITRDYDIIITGGGIIERKENRNILKKHTTIFINRHIENIIEEIKLRNENIWDCNLNDKYLYRLKYYNECSKYQYLNNFKLEESMVLFNSWLQNIFIKPVINNISYFICLCNDDFSNLDEISKGVDAIELRGDLLLNYDLDYIDKVIFELFKLTNKHIIFTFRSKEEGGNYDGNDIYKYLNRALYNGIRILDIELKLKYNVNRKNNLIIGSCHNDNWNILEQTFLKGINKHNPDIIKLVGSIGLLTKMKKMISKYKKKYILIESGNEGKISRVQNMFLTPVTHSKINSVAKGQLTLNEIINIRKLLNINQYEKQFYLIGKNISKSPSPFIHNKVFDYYDLSYNYDFYDIKNINEIDNIIGKINFGGASVTIPYKEQIIQYLDVISDDAKNIGAVNTIFKKDNLLYGYNTDWIALYNLINKIDLSNKYGCVIGTGGAARSACYAFKKLNIKYDILGRNIKNCENLKKKFNCNNVCELNELKNIYNIVIICIPNNVNLNLNNISKNGYILDMSYHKNSNRLYYNRKIIDGYKILTEQAIKQFEIWENKKCLKYYNYIDIFLNNK